MTKLIIFDMDGTLLDTIDDIATACNYALKACGCPERKREEYFMLVGRGIDNLFQHMRINQKILSEFLLEVKIVFL